MRFTHEELEYLRRWRFLKSDFVDLLGLFQLDRRFISLTPAATPGEIDITIKGPWLHTILFEVPVLAIVSEVYFRETIARPDLAEGRRRLDAKIAQINAVPDPEFRIADYGTRRRFSRAWQDEVVRTLKEGIGPKFVGTSNVKLALDHNLTPLGTMAHEYLQACQAVGPRLRDSQVFAFNTWAREYRGDLGIALSDVCGMDAFLRDFDLFFCKLFDGVRHDSGDPFEWGEKLIAHYQKMRIDPRSKVMVFSDSLNVPLAIRLFEYFKGRSQTAFGIGTNLTNDLGYERAADRDQDDALQRPAGRQDQRRAVEGDGLRSVVRRLSAPGVRGARAGGDHRRRRARRRLADRRLVRGQHVGAGASEHDALQRIERGRRLAPSRPRSAPPLSADNRTHRS